MKVDYMDDFTKIQPFNVDMLRNYVDRLLNRKEVE